MDIALHKGQWEVFTDPHKIRIFVAGRRTGKSSLMIYEIILRALNFPGKTDKRSPETVLGALPTLPMAKKILWQPLVNLFESDFAPVVKDINKTEHRIILKGNKPAIQIASYNDQNGDRLRGLRLYFAALDEWQNSKPGILETIILPAMADTKGSKALITGTPMGLKNPLYTAYKMAEVLPNDYASFNMPTSVNPFVSKTEIEAARLRLPPKLFRQEFLASWEDFDNQFYTELSEENLVNYVPNSFDLVVMGCDLGDRHPAMVVLGRSKGVYYFLEGWQTDGSQVVPDPTFDAQALRLATKWNVDVNYVDPSRPASILRLRSIGTQHGCRGLQQSVAGYNAIAEGINQVHSLIYQKRLMFPTVITSHAQGYVSGKEAYDLMMSYHRMTARDGTILDVPADGIESHINDSCRYALAVKSGV